MRPTIIFPLHGIRTRAAWQRALCDLAQDHGWRCSLDGWYYGRFSVFQFANPLSRHAKVEWFREQYSNTLNRYKQSLDLSADRCPSIVAHSFGTYVVGNALLRYSEIRLDTLILCGSILPRDFPWKTLLERGQVQQVLSFHSEGDFWVRVGAWLIPGTGESGARGFTQNHDRLIQRPGLGHCEYFNKEWMEENWLVPLCESGPPVVPARRSSEPATKGKGDHPVLSRILNLAAWGLVLAIAWLCLRTTFLYAREELALRTLAMECAVKMEYRTDLQRWVYSASRKPDCRRLSQQLRWLRHKHILELERCEELDVADLRSVPMLEQVRFKGVQAFTGLGDLRDSQHLTSVVLEKCGVSSIDVVWPSVESLQLITCDNLESISIDRSSGLTYFLASNCKRLNEVRGLGNAGQLARVQFRKCGALTSLDIAPGLAALRVLAVSEGGLQNLYGLTRARKLTHLDLSETPIRALSGTFPSLKTLCLSGCSQLWIREGGAVATARLEAPDATAYVGRTKNDHLLEALRHLETTIATRDYDGPIP